MAMMIMMMIFWISCSVCACVDVVVQLREGAPVQVMLNDFDRQFASTYGRFLEESGRALFE